MNKTLYVHKSRAGQTIRTETGPFNREKAVNTKNNGYEADFLMIPRGGMSDLSASLTGSVKVKRPGGG